jgi:hypothetical protein
MSLIIQPSQADQRKTFYATKVRAYNTVGIKRGHLPPIVAAAICLGAAKEHGCEDIVVCPEGCLPRRYTVKSVEAAIAKNPRPFRSFLPQPLTPEQAAMARLKFAHEQRTQSGLFLVER